MNDYTILLIAVALGSLIIMILKRHPAILLTATASGMGGFFSILNDITTDSIDTPDGGFFLLVVMVIVVGWSIIGWFDLIKKGEGRR